MGADPSETMRAHEVNRKGKQACLLSTGLPTSPHRCFMRAADTMRFPGIVVWGFFPNEAVLTFPSAPRTYNLHGDLAFLP